MNLDDAPPPTDDDFFGDDDLSSPMVSSDAQRLAQSLAYAHAKAGLQIPARDIAIIERSFDIDTTVLETAIEAGAAVGLESRLADISMGMADSSDENWPKRIGLSRSIPVPVMSDDMLPEIIRPWISDIAMRACLPLEVVAVPAIVAASSLIGRNAVVRPDTNSGWTTPPNLWGAIVARAGLLKSHAISAALRPISWLARLATEEHQNNKRANEAKRISIEGQLAHQKRIKAPDPELIENLLESLESLDTKERRYRTNDPTIEKLGELLIENPRGLLLIRDELGGWLSSMRRQGREGDREFFLEAWNGDSSYTVDRIGRGTIHIPGMCLSIVGGLQPGKLKAHVLGAISGGYEDDGLLQRLQLLVWPDAPPQWNRCSGEPDDHAMNEACARYNHIDQLCSQRWQYPVTWSLDAQGLYDAWRDALEERLRSNELAASPSFESHLGKYRGLLPSLAMVFWMLEGCPTERIAVDDFELAKRWCDFLELHARKVYEPELDIGAAAARAMARRIEDGSVEHGMTVRDIQRSKWSGLATPELVSGALAELQMLGWIRVVSVRGSANRSRSEVRLHPELRRGA